MKVDIWKLYKEDKLKGNVAKSVNGFKQISYWKHVGSSIFLTF